MSIDPTNIGLSTYYYINLNVDGDLLICIAGDGISFCTFVLSSFHPICSCFFFLTLNLKGMRSCFRFVSEIRNPLDSCWKALEGNISNTARLVVALLVFLLILSPSFLINSTCPASHGGWLKRQSKILEFRCNSIRSKSLNHQVTTTHLFPPVLLYLPCSSSSSGSPLLTTASALLLRVLVLLLLIIQIIANQ